MCWRQGARGKGVKAVLRGRELGPGGEIDRDFDSAIVTGGERAR